MTRFVLSSVPLIHRTPRRVRELLDSWRFWFGAALVGVTVAVVVGYYNFDRIQRDEASRRTVAYESCVQGIPELRKIATHVKGVNRFAAIIVANSGAILAATPPSAPTYHARVKAHQRIAAAYQQIHAAPTVPVPTRASCLKSAEGER